MVRLLVFLAACQTVHIINIMLMMPLGPRLMDALGLGSAGFAIALAAYTAGAAAGGLAGMAWLDRVDRRRTQIALTVALGLATAAAGMASDAAVLVAFRFLAGACGQQLAAINQAIVVEAIPATHRARGMSALGTALSLAQVAGVPLGIALAQWGDWHTPFYAIGIVAGVLALVGAAILPPLPAPPRRPGGGLREDLRTIVGHGDHWRAFLLGILVVGAGQMVFPQLAISLVKNVGVSEAQLIPLYIAVGLATMAGGLATGAAADRWGTRRIYAITAIAAIPACLIVTNLPPLPLALAVLAAVGVAVPLNARFAPAFTLISSAALPRVRAQTLALAGTFQSAAAALATLAGGFLTVIGDDGRLHGYAACGWIAAALSLISLWAAWRMPVR